MGMADAIRGRKPVATRITANARNFLIAPSLYLDLSHHKVTVLKGSQRAGLMPHPDVIESGAVFGNFK